jgi:myo-inositol-1(or 4)-monophosphatase
MGVDLGAARDLAVSLARDAGALQVRERAGVTVVATTATKAHANDLVSEIDLASERLIVDGLRAAFPEDGILAEEGVDSTGTSGRRWVVDPLDGTRNYLSAGPWSVCLALHEGEETLLAVVHDPAADETFSAVAGRGALLNERRITASATSALSAALVAFSFNPSPATKPRVAGLIAALLPQSGDMRRLPSALNLAYLAAGRFDAGVLVDTKPWDIAAGLLVAREAGVVLAGADGGPPSPALTLAAGKALWPEFSAAAGAALAAHPGDPAR